METKEIRCFGPPGTGKTTWLARQIEAAADKHGADNVVVASYTKTAAEELNSRQLSIPAGNVGTLHALCYRAMGSPEIAETHAKEFNEAYPQFAISVTGSGVMDDVDVNFKTDGDRCLAVYNVHRAQMIHPDKLPQTIHGFRMAWENWKFSNNYVDFTDMISYAIVQERQLPGNPRIGFFDEAQDFNPIMLKLLRMWSQQMEYIILAGDDDQTLYSFSGASPDAFLNPPIGDEYKRILTQSYRLPRAVQEFSARWIQQVKHREPKEFAPRDFEGSVTRCNATIETPDLAIEQAWRLAEEGKTVMFLTTCSYQLKTIEATLKKYSIPFHNPFRPARSDWNPLGSFSTRRGPRGRVSTRSRILAFLDRSEGDFWNADSFERWVSILKTRGVFKKGGKDLIADIGEIEQTFSFYQQVFEPAALDLAINRNMQWFMDSMQASKLQASEYPVGIYKKRGVEALLKVPKIITGTIHSVKGGEVDTTFLFPDISLAAQEGMRHDRDSMIRTFYVGMTRCRESLVICNPASNLYVKL